MVSCLCRIDGTLFLFIRQYLFLMIFENLRHTLGVLIVQPSSQLLSPEKIKYLRKDNGWSQELLAKASGLSLRTIQRAEKDGNCSVETQLALAAAFDIFPKELTQDLNQPEVNWKRKNIMFNAIALTAVLGAVIILFRLAGDIGMFVDPWSITFVVLFMYAATAVAYGGQGLVKSITGLRYLFASEVNYSPASNHLSKILTDQIKFVYGGSAVGALIGLIAILSHTSPGEEAVLPAYAVMLLVILYAAIISECILRPLSTKLKTPQD
jgi:transcriptional regulator with XRE-family HTH domain